MQYTKEQLLRIHDVLNNKRNAIPGIMLGINGLIHVLDLCDEYLSYGSFNDLLSRNSQEREPQIAVLDKLMDYMHDKEPAVQLCVAKVMIDKQVGIHTASGKCRAFIDMYSKVVSYVREMDITTIPDVVTL